MARFEIVIDRVEFPAEMFFDDDYDVDDLSVRQMLGIVEEFVKNADNSFREEVWGEDSDPFGTVEFEVDVSAFDEDGDFEDGASATVYMQPDEPYSASGNWVYRGSYNDVLMYSCASLNEQGERDGTWWRIIDTNDYVERRRVSDVHYTQETPPMFRDDDEDDGEEFSDWRLRIWQS